MPKQPNKPLTNFSKLTKRYRPLLFILTAICIISCNYAFSTPALSQNAVKQSLTPEQLGKIINKTERSWEYDYEEYFQKDFTNYSKTESQIARQLTELSKQTGNRAAVMWAVPTEKQLYLLLITPGKDPIIESVRSADGKTLSKTIDNFYQTIHQSLKINSTAYLPPAKQLYRWLIAPIEPNLVAENIDTIMLCSGSSLRAFPFAALHDGDKFLAEKYSMVRLPAFNLTQINYEDNRLEPKRVLAMGASKFEDLPPLPGVEVEVPTITPQTLPGEAMLNREFTVENLKSQHQQGNFDLIHLATHAEFNPGSASNSYIQFGDTKLSLNRVDELGLNDPPVDLLVLSACQTAVGNKEAEFGFAGLALQAGVKSALASLWKIDDAGTVALMSEFYQNLKSTTMKAEALQRAQIAMIEGKVYLEEGRLKSSRGAVSLPATLTSTEYNNLSHPYYWAGFSLIGNPW